MSVLPRRRFLAGLPVVAAGAASLVVAEDAWSGEADEPAPRTPPDFTVREIELGDARELALAGRFALAVPNHLAKDERVPLLVLFHGLGETGDRTTGVFAWIERYGLGTSYARLRRPPLVRTSRRADLLDASRLAGLNASIAARPFRGMAIACPYTPPMARLPDGELDRYASWVVDKVIARARRDAPVIPDAAHTAVDGVSLGGAVGLEVFCRRPDAFRAWGGVQAAIGAGRAEGLADRLVVALASAPIGVASSTRVHIETSEGDPFREPSVALAAALVKKGARRDLTVLPGAHDQVFLRESGTIEMLLWHDRWGP